MSTGRALPPQAFSGFDGSSSLGGRFAGQTGSLTLGWAMGILSGVWTCSDNVLLELQGGICSHRWLHTREH